LKVVKTPTYTQINNSLYTVQRAYYIIITEKPVTVTDKVSIVALWSKIIVLIVLIMEQ